MQTDVEEISRQLPYYLMTAEQKDWFVAELKNFGQKNFYTSKYQEEILQGDGWSSVEIIRFSDAKRDLIKGLVLSNSCDIDPENHRHIPALITFAPLIALKNFINALESSGLASQQIKDKVTAIREQRVSSIFFLPRGAQMDDDHIAMLDNLHTVPLMHHIAQQRKEKVFTLSQVAFYIFSMKLSIHFCRLHEGLER